VAEVTSDKETTYQTLNLNGLVQIGATVLLIAQYGRRIRPRPQTRGGARARGRKWLRVRY
jgi:hypothetical protein